MSGVGSRNRDYRFSGQARSGRLQAYGEVVPRKLGVRALATHNGRAQYQAASDNRRLQAHGMMLPAASDDRLGRTLHPLSECADDQSGDIRQAIPAIRTGSDARNSLEGPGEMRLISEPSVERELRE
jgi:hypothetical protein